MEDKDLLILHNAMAANVLVMQGIDIVFQKYSNFDIRSIETFKFQNDTLAMVQQREKKQVGT